MQHLSQNPSALSDFIAFCEQMKQSCYRRALDGGEDNLRELRGERDAYNAVQSLAQQVQASSITAEQVMAQLYPR